MIIKARPADRSARQRQALLGRRVIYLNRHGGRFEAGEDDASANTTSVLAEGATATLGELEIGDRDFDALLACTRHAFQPFDVEVTDVDPGASPHIECAFGGHPAQIGYDEEIAGLAPLDWDCLVLDRAVVFVFVQMIVTSRELCLTVIHEAGHALGLDHVLLCKDPMTYLGHCGPKAFQDVAADCGEDAQRPCQCGAQQNSVQHLFAQVGPAQREPPQVLGVEVCGTLTDSCGQALECGGCVAPQICGGGGIPNLCACQPDCAGRACGDDGCGGQCGTCYAPEVCDDGACCRPYGEHCNPYFPQECCTQFCRSGFCDTW